MLLQYKDYLAVNALYEQITKDAESTGKIKNDNMEPSEFVKVKKHYFAE